MTHLDYRSYGTRVTISRSRHMTAEQGEKIIALWISALTSDLFAKLNSDNLARVQAPAIAAAARDWCKDAARHRLGAEYGDFTVDSVTIRLFRERNMEGAVLAEINALAGTYRL